MNGPAIIFINHIDILILNCFCFTMYNSMDTYISSFIKVVWFLLSIDAVDGYISYRIRSPKDSLESVGKSEWHFLEWYN